MRHGGGGKEVVFRFRVWLAVWLVEVVGSLSIGATVVQRHAGLPR